MSSLHAVVLLLAISTDPFLADPGDTAPAMSNGKDVVPFENTGNPGNAMDAKA